MHDPRECSHQWHDMATRGQLVSHAGAVAPSMQEGNTHALPPGHPYICGHCAQELTSPDRPSDASPDHQGALAARARLQDAQRPYDRLSGTEARQADFGDWVPTRRLQAIQADINQRQARLADDQRSGEGHTGVTRRPEVTKRVREWRRASQDQGIER
jgi:hypothetical protein